MAVSVGQKAPDFELVDNSNQPIKLSNFKGKNVVLAFYPAAYSGVCDKEMCAFRDSMSEFNGMNAQVLGIAVDSRFTGARFAKDYDLKFPILSDHQRSAIKAYGVEFPNFGMPGYTAALRSVFVIDGGGTIKWSWLAPSQGTEPPYDEVKKAVSALKKSR